MANHLADSQSHGTMPLGLPLRAMPLYIFVHVPKAAGTSVRHVLRGMFKEFYWQLSPSGPRSGSADGKVGWKQKGFFDAFLAVGIGHNSVRHPIVSAARHSGRRLVFISTVREPSARAASLYDYIRRHPEHPIYEEVSNRSLLGALESAKRFRKATENAQLRQLFGCQDRDEIAAVVRKENFIVGRQDNLDALWDAISAVSGFPRATCLPRINAADSGSAVVLDRARDQPDYTDALARLTDFNAAEVDFLATYVSEVLVTIATQPRERAGAAVL